MIRKLILSAVIATGTVVGLTATHATAAPPVGHDHEHDRDRDHDRRGVRYEVLVRHRGHWDHYATYRDRDDARRAVWMLERRGHDARIEVERGRW